MPICWHETAYSSATSFLPGGPASWKQTETTWALHCVLICNSFITKGNLGGRHRGFYAPILLPSSLSMCSYQVWGPGLEFSLLSLDIWPWTNPIPPLWPLVSSFVKGAHNAILAPHRFLLRSTYVMDMQWLWNITCCSGCRALLIVLFLLVPLPEYFLAKLCISVICFISAPNWVVDEIMTRSSLSRLDLTM